MPAVGVIREREIAVRVRVIVVVFVRVPVSVSVRPAIAVILVPIVGMLWRVLMVFMRRHDIVVLRPRRVEVNVRMDLDLVSMRQIAVRVVVGRGRLRRRGRNAHGGDNRCEPAGTKQRAACEVFLPLGEPRLVRGVVRQLLGWRRLVFVSIFRHRCLRAVVRARFGARRSVCQARQPCGSARVLRHEPQSCLGRQPLEPPVPREPFAVHVHQQMLKVSLSHDLSCRPDASSTSISRPGISRTRL